MSKDLIDYFDDKEFKEDICKILTIRRQWSIEIMDYYLDVIFKEDSSKTIEKIENKNKNIIRKWALSILKLLNMEKK